VETIDFSFALRCTRLVVATLVELAGVHTPDGMSISKEETAPPDVDWKRDSGGRFLFTLSPSNNHADVIDISVPGIHARRRIVLESVPEETWATPRLYPTDATLSPSGRFVVVTSVRLRAPGDESGNGTLRVIDPVTAEMTREVSLGRFPGAGSFNTEGTRYYQPYWGEDRIDVFDSKSFERLNEIPSPLPVGKLRIDDKGEVGVGVSPNSDSVLIFNLKEGTLEKRMSDIKTPRDLVLLEGGRYAVVSGYAPSRLFLIDVMQKEIVHAVESPPRPRHLIPAPEGNRFLSVHQASSRVGIFRVVDEGGTPRIEEDAPLDLEEEVVHASFADGGDLVYFISSGRQRLFGMDPARREIVWGMRTGDVRARGGVEHILYIENP
jgi:DNA-binding beta-propeller fold protein YncE